MIASPDNSQTALAWFNQARYGMFIHWGPYAVAGRGEWVINRELLSKEVYIRDYVQHFRAENYAPSQWVQLAKEAGMGYMILTARHHDGFCLWNTQTTEFNAVRLGPKRDVLRPYVEAARAGGLKVGLYYSVADWFHPDYPGAYFRDWPESWSDEEKRQRFVRFYHSQLEELMTQYGQIDLLWYDGCIPQPTDGGEINRRIKQWQPQILINDRNGVPCDFKSCEQAIKPAPPGTSWESCMTLNQNWGYCPGDSEWKSPREVIRMLVETAKSAGNLLLNVGPKSDGTIPRQSVEIIREAGVWLKRNGEFLPNSTRSPFSWTNWGHITTRDNRIYLHIFISQGSNLCVADIKNPVKSARLLDSGQAIPFEQHPDRLFLRGLPSPLSDPIATTVVLEVEGAPETLKPQTSFWIPG